MIWHNREQHKIELDAQKGDKNTGRNQIKKKTYFRNEE